MSDLVLVSPTFDSFYLLENVNIKCPILILSCELCDLGYVNFDPRGIWINGSLSVGDKVIAFNSNYVRL